MEGRAPLEGPLSASMVVQLPVPASWSRKKRADALAGIIRPTSKPDADNYAKAALDAFNQIVFVDDSQVVDLSVRKIYAETPRLVVTVEAA